MLCVAGDSMVPAYKSGDVALLTTVDSELDVRNNQFCVFVIELDSGSTVVKRLIGVPGDTVELVEGDTYVNGILVMPRRGKSWDNVTYELGPDDWFFLGDNREISLDGRWWQPPFVRLDNIKAMVLFSKLDIYNS